MSTSPKRRRRRLLIALAVFLAGLLVYAALPGRITHTIGPDTTRVTGPLDADGRLDYVAALNSRLRAGIAPEQNANILLWQAVGPQPGGEAMPGEYFEWLGCPAPPEEGEYLLPWEPHQSAMAGVLGPDGVPLHTAADLAARHARAGKWPWKAADDPVTADWISTNAPALAVVATAAQRPAYHNPLVTRRSPAGREWLQNPILSNVVACRQAGAVLVRRAMLHLGEGRPDDAWRDLMTCHRLGRLVERGGAPTEYLTGLAIQAAAIDAELIFLSEANPTAGRLATCQADLRQLPLGFRVADKIDLFRRHTLLDIIQHLADAGLTTITSTDDVRRAGQDPAAPGRLFGMGVNWDPGLRLVNAWEDRFVDLLRNEDLVSRRVQTEIIEHELNDLRSGAALRSRIPVLLTPGQRGETMASLLLRLDLPAVKKVSDAQGRLAQLHHHLDIVLALAAYRFEHGEYPPRLSRLAPRFLPEPPRDLFTNEDHLMYRRTPGGYSFRSYGINQSDDQGRGRDDSPPGDDLVIEMPATPPAPLQKPPPADLPQ